ncbi:hypothetical protein [Streptomyces sp. 8L]|uniref:hypothetical protein n=1 Tax=Streptomyces sp. 8L TaxID=2877242 RepID=UPI001CD54FBE|nr:hypothetical protein [Streptomyces sp. 8L]MCA1223555.1 hypothetical protein [Streptomyces sp. 8L]
MSEGLVIKTDLYPHRIQGPREHIIHAAKAQDSGLTLVTTCGKRKREEAVNHHDESTPITCPDCQRRIQNYS